MSEIAKFGSDEKITEVTTMSIGYKRLYKNGWMKLRCESVCE